MKKRLLFLFLACISIFILGTITVSAAEVTEEGFHYVDNGSTIEIVGYSGTETEIVIPSEINGKPVTQIGFCSVFSLSGNENIKSVTIPDSVTEIARDSFHSWSNLESVIIGNNVEKIGDYSFYSCKRLTNVVIPDSVEIIGDHAFSNVDNLITIDGEYSGEEGSYSYMVVLRPWGTMWDDVEESSLPYYYNDWYLPLIINGASMPDSLSETGGEVPSEEEPESTDEPSAAATGNQVPFSIDGKTPSDLPFTFAFSLPEGVWDMETYMFPYNFKIHNCPDGDDVPWDTPFIWVMFYDSETSMNTDVPNYENLSETEGRTVGGIEMQGRKYDRYGYEQMQEYYGILPSGIGVSIRLVKVPDSLVHECLAILDTFTFN